MNNCETDFKQRIDDYRSSVQLQDFCLRIRLAAEELRCEVRRSTQDLICQLRRTAEDVVSPLSGDAQMRRRQTRADADRFTQDSQRAVDEWKREMVAQHFEVLRALDQVAERRFREPERL